MRTSREKNTTVSVWDRPTTRSGRAYMTPGVLRSTVGAPRARVPAHDRGKGRDKQASLQQASTSTNRSRVCCHGHRSTRCRECSMDGEGGGSLCVHHRPRTACFLCRAGARGEILKLSLTELPFEAMLSMEKNREYKPLTDQGRDALWIQSRLFHKGVQGYDWNRPRPYRFVQFYNGRAASDLKYHWFIRTYGGLRVVYNVNESYSNGLVVRHDQQPVASIKLGKLVCVSAM